jgi:hypothetical protein
LRLNTEGHGVGDGLDVLLYLPGTVRVFRQKFTLEDAIGSHACSLEANTRVTNGIPLGSSPLLRVDTVNCVGTLKVVSQVPTIVKMVGDFEPQDGAYIKKDKGDHVVVVAGTLQVDHLREFLESARCSVSDMTDVCHWIRWLLAGHELLSHIADWTEHNIALVVAIGSHACSLESGMRVIQWYTSLVSLL